MTLRPSGALIAVVHGSRLAQAMSWLDRTSKSAWEDSKTRQFANAAWNKNQAWSAAQRLRFWALVLTWAGVFHIAGLQWLPRYVTSGLPMPWFAAGTMLAAILAAFAEPAAVAWRDSAIRRAIGPDEISPQSRNSLEST